MPNQKRRKDVRNIAIVAHVDHGKTTLVDTLLKFTGAHKFEEGETTIMDSNPLECDLLYHAASHPRALYTVKLQQNVHNVAYQTARTDLLELEKKGFLSKIKIKGKEFAFVPAKELHSKIKNLLTSSGASL